MLLPVTQSTVPASSCEKTDDLTAGQVHPFGASLPHAQLMHDADMLADVGANFVRGR